MSQSVLGGAILYDFAIESNLKSSLFVPKLLRKLYNPKSSATRDNHSFMNLKKIVPVLNASLVKHLPDMKGVAFNQVLQAFEKLQKKGWMKIHYNPTL